MGLAWLWPSGRQGTACNTCAGAKQKCRGGEVERPERPEKKKVRATQTRQTAESEEEWVDMWVPQAPRVRVAYISITERARKGPWKKRGKIVGKSRDRECRQITEPQVTGPVALASHVTQEARAWERRQ